MIEAADQVFVWLKHWLVNQAPATLRPTLGVLLSAGPLLIAFSTLFVLTTLLERKGLGRIQNRLGPNRVGPFGLLQPVADGLKAMIKEDVVPRAADHVVHFLAPLLFLVVAALALAVLPCGRNMTALDLDAGILFFFAVGSAGELAVFMAGWSSRNKYSLLGAMRAIAQMVSYEVPFVLSTIPVIMLTASLSPTQIVDAQAGWLWDWMPRWHVFTPWGLAGFVLFFIAALAEANRAPFDIPEGESEIIAGHLVEYSGFKFALFFMAEYFGLFAACGLGVSLFLGGWRAPLPALEWIPSYAWFFGKLVALVCVCIWIRGTVPRLRMDQLMNFAWKFMLPLAVWNIIVAGIWKFSAGPTSGVVAVVRWLIVAALLVVPYVVLARGLVAGQRVRQRNYRFAT